LGLPKTYRQKSRGENMWPALRLRLNNATRSEVCIGYLGNSIDFLIFLYYRQQHILLKGTRLTKALLRSKLPPWIKLYRGS
jgi:hypothetical protein